MRLVRRALVAGLVLVLLSARAAEAADLYETARRDGRFQVFLQGLKATGLLRTLRGKGPFMVFAPTDQAFSRLADLETLQRPDHAEEFSRLLALHIVARPMTSRLLRDRESGFVTLSGAEIRVDGRGSDLLVQGIKVSTPDILAQNGVMHAIDDVLVPPGSGIK
jgi:uncharacterized surface protein with fasciclin (FAS1) repeats